MECALEATIVQLELQSQSLVLSGIIWIAKVEFHQMIVSNAKQENIVQLLDWLNQLVIVKLLTTALKVQH
jgi:hypothetical protein